MKTFVINKNSWHYRFIKWMGAQPPDDICAYTRKLFFCFLGFLAATAFFTIVITFFGGILICMFLYPFMHWKIGSFWSAVAIAGYIITGFGLFILSFVSLVSWVKDKKNNVLANEPGFVRQAYRSFKDKYCIKLDFK